MHSVVGNDQVLHQWNSLISRLPHAHTQKHTHGKVHVGNMEQGQGLKKLQQSYAIQTAAITSH